MTTKNPITTFNSPPFKQMELLNPVCTPHHNPTRESLSGLSSPGGFLVGFDRTVIPQSPGIFEEGSSSNSSAIVYVAVGKSAEKASSLLHWVFKRFESKEICLLHVHRPSPLIPTLCNTLYLLFLCCIAC